MISAEEALERLREGNRRFVAGVSTTANTANPARRSELSKEQHPFAIILGCSDSRVPAEIIFDQGLGDLFVIRVVGNVVAAPQVGSIEFAAEWLGARLVVVLGHTRCGAIQAALNEITGDTQHLSDNLRSIIDHIRSIIESLMATEVRNDLEAVAREAVRANVLSCADRLRHSSQVVKKLIQEGRLVVVGAEYSLDSGKVDFFDGVPTLHHQRI